MLFSWAVTGPYATPELEEWLAAQTDSIITIPRNLTESGVWNFVVTAQNYLGYTATANITVSISFFFFRIMSPTLLITYLDFSRYLRSECLHRRSTNHIASRYESSHYQCSIGITPMRTTNKLLNHVQMEPNWRYVQLH